MWILSDGEYSHERTYALGETLCLLLSFIYFQRESTSHKSVLTILSIKYLNEKNIKIKY